MGLARRCDPIIFALPAGSAIPVRFDHTLGFKTVQNWVKRTFLKGKCARGLFFNGLDHLIAIHGLFIQQTEYQNHGTPLEKFFTYLQIIPSISSDSYA